MAAGRTKSFHRAGSLMRSKSEGTLIDLDESVSIDSLKGKVQIGISLIFFNSVVIVTVFLTKLQHIHRWDKSD